MERPLSGEFARADKGADKATGKFGGFGFREALQRGASAAGRDVVQGVAARNLDVDIDEASLRQKAAVGLFFQRARDTAGPRLQVMANGRGQFSQLRAAIEVAGH